MKLKVTTPDKGTEIDKDIYFVEAEGLNGSLGILEDHVPFITPLKNKSILKYQTKKTTHMQVLELEDSVLEVTKQNKQTEVRVIASKVLYQ